MGTTIDRERAPADRAAPPILVLGGEVVLYDQSRHPLGIPRGYGMCFDPSGESLPKCSLFFGPIRTTNDRVDLPSGFARRWFGESFEAKKAVVDIPQGRWQPFARIVEILYYRVGDFDGDWRHEFESPVPMGKHGKWYRLQMPTDCIVTHRGIVRP